MEIAPHYNRPVYSAELLDHFQNPRNAGVVATPDATARLENPACGDILELSVRLEKRIGREAHRRHWLSRQGLRSRDGLRISDYRVDPRQEHRGSAAREQGRVGSQSRRSASGLGTRKSFGNRHARRALAQPLSEREFLCLQIEVVNPAANPTRILSGPRVTTIFSPTTSSSAAGSHTRY